MADQVIAQEDESPAVAKAMARFHARDAEVQKSRQTGHTCHCPTCETPVPPKLHSCARHWKVLPYAIRRAIWDAYIPGQERRKDPSEAYIAAAMAARRWAQLEREEGLMRNQVDALLNQQEEQRD